MHLGAFVTVKVEQCGRILLGFTFKVIRVATGRSDNLNKGIDALDGVVGQQPALGNHVMATTGGATQYLNQVETLAINIVYRVNAMVRDRNQGGLVGERSLLNCRPDSTEN